MKEIILKKLKENESLYISGETLSDSIGVSRTQVWKYINELKKEGYKIESSSRKGYRLIGGHDILNSFEISNDLNTNILGKDVYCLKTIDSTNNYAKKIASENNRDGILIVAETQTAGRGRLGRQWDSHAEKGIWMSVILRPSIPPESVQIITIAASVAVAAAINKACGINAGIKWPNDIILDGRKVCGILTEMSCELDRINYLVIGIGINVNHNPEDFNDEIKNTAISLKTFSNGKTFTRSELIRNILLELEKQYYRVITYKTDEIINEWKSMSVTLGRTIKVNINGREKIGIAESITNDGKLVFKSRDGDKSEILSGEISVRGILGYL